ncbi:cytochrome P450 [Streptomyces sp. NPDC001581]|uniref:cytochrome P450 n=1 Tax=Streptomyces sp. NPDC001581 TaxID=3154386 RepID=UPI00331E3946
MDLVPPLGLAGRPGPARRGARPCTQRAPPAYDDYEQLTWTQQIVKEALQLYPPAWIIPPRVARDGAALAGIPIRAGTTVGAAHGRRTT